MSNNKATITHTRSGKWLVTWGDDYKLCDTEKEAKEHVAKVKPKANTKTDSNS